MGESSASELELQFSSDSDSEDKAQVKPIENDSLQEKVRQNFEDENWRTKPNVQKCKGKGQNKWPQPQSIELLNNHTGGTDRLPLPPETPMVQSNFGSCNFNNCVFQRENPLMNHLILKNIFTKVNYLTLQAVRLVCQDWNELSTPLWSQSSKISVTQEKLNMSGMSTDESISKLHFIVANAPEGFLNTLYVDLETLELPEFQQLLVDLGKNVRKMFIISTDLVFEMDLKLLHKVLVTLCPKLVELKIFDDLPLTLSAEDANILETNGIPHQLALEKLEFAIEERDAKLAHPLISIVKASPKFQSLVGFFHPRVFMEFFVILSGSPNVSKNLVNLTVAGTNCSQIIPLNILTDLEFSDKLIELNLNSFNPRSKSDLTNLLRKVAGSLESLTLSGTFNVEDVPRAAAEIEFPAMKKLKKFTNNRIDLCKISSFDAMKSMENLECIYLNHHIGQYGMVDFDLILKNSIVLQRRPLLKVKELTISSICNSDSPAIISRIFPNLTALKVVVGPAENPYTIDFWNAKMLFAITKIPKLTILYLKFDHLNWHVDSEVKSTFQPVAFSRLENLTLVAERKGQFLSIGILDIFESNVSCSPNAHLKHVTLIGYDMSLKQANLLFRRSEALGIHLKAVDYEYEVSSFPSSKN